MTTSYRISSSVKILKNNVPATSFANAAKGYLSRVSGNYKICAKKVGDNTDEGPGWYQAFERVRGELVALRGVSSVLVEEAKVGT